MPIRTRLHNAQASAVVFHVIVEHGQPVELAPIYVFLASAESSHITGEVIGATGGKPLG